MEEDPTVASEETLRRGFILRGRVQGVGFRWWTRRNAEKLGLSGTVRNRPDGGVELHVRGGAEAVRGLEELLRRGPPGSRVDAIEEVEPPPHLPDDFRIVR